MTGTARFPDHLDDRQRTAVERAMVRWRGLHPPPGWLRPGEAEGATPPAGKGADPQVAVVDVELIAPGRPGVLDVVAEVDGRLAHAVFGLRSPGDDLHLVGSVEEPALGVVEDDEGLAVLVDAMHEAGAARELLDAVAGTAPRRHRDTAAREPAGSVVTLVGDDVEATVLGFDRRWTLSVFPWLRRGPNPAVTFLAGLDEAGFNHLPAPIAIWRRAGRDLGVVQELLAGAAGGWALALTSLRDLFAAGVTPDTAGGDFGPEARALGTMAARMHIALDRAFGRRSGSVAAWAEEAARRMPPGAGATGAGPVHEALRALGRLRIDAPTIRTHGDLHLGRTARTDHGWVLADCMPGGTEPGSADPVYRSPLADVADLSWSMRRAATVAAFERGPVTEPSRTTELAEAWAARNRGAFLATYLSTPGIEALLPADREVVRQLVTVLEAARTARSAAAFGPAA